MDFFGTLQQKTDSIELFVAKIITAALNMNIFLILLNVSLK